MTGMALAAGLGTRMRPLTESRPKPLISVGGRALLDHALDRLAACGCTTAIVNVHHFADQVEAHLALRTGVPDVVVSDERACLLETGGGLAKARPLLGDAPVLVTNTDAIFLGDPARLRALFDGFDPAREDARLILTPKALAAGLEGAGDFNLDGANRLARPAKGGSAPYFYTGMQILSPAIFADQPVEPFSMWRVWEPALRAGRLTGAVFGGGWLHVGDPAGLAAAEARLQGVAR